MKRLKILHVVENFYPIYGGVTSVVDGLCESLSQFADVTVATVEADLKKGEVFKELQRSYKIVRCKGYKNKLTGDMVACPASDKNFRTFIKEGDFDIIHCHFPLALASYVSRIARKRGIPVIQTIHSLYWYDIQNFIKCKPLADIATRIAVARIQKNADYIWAVSQFCKDFLQKFGLKGKVEVVYNCTEQEVFNKEKLSHASFANVKKHKLTLLTVGRLVKIKNLDLILDSLHLLKNDNLDIHTYIVGSGANEKHLRAKVTKLGLEEQVTFTGPITDKNVLANFYRASDLVLFPSCADSAGLIHVEGAMYGKPTLAIENTAISEKIKDGINGLVSKNNSLDFSNKIRYAYQNKEKLLKMGENAKSSLVRVYSDPAVAMELYQKYCSAVTLFTKNQYIFGKETAIIKKQI